jgi:NitT/TauT family transport system ATP-binding protein
VAHRTRTYRLNASHTAWLHFGYAHAHSKFFQSEPGRVESHGWPTIHASSDEIGKEFGEPTSVVKAAKILERVDTPKQDVRLTGWGRKFVASDRVVRRKIFAEQVFKRRLFHSSIARLHENEAVEADRVIQDIASALPSDNPERVFQTRIAWGR